MVIRAWLHLTRAERVDTRRAFLAFVPAQYVSDGVSELDQEKLPGQLELRYHAISDAAAQLGGVARIRDAFIGFQKSLYDA